MRKGFIKKFDSPSDKIEFDRQNVAYNIHNAVIILYVIIGFEVFMLLRVFLTKTPPYPLYVWQYIACYIFLLVLSLANLFCVYYSEHRKKDRTGFMDAVTTVYVVGFGLWAVALALLDSHESAQFTVYLTVMVCMPSLLRLRPWLFLSLEIGGEALLACGMLVFRDAHDLSQLLNLTVFTVIFVLISIVKYNNTVIDFYNKKKIDRLNELLEDEKDLLEKAAKTDRLTGLLNRNVLKEDITKRIAANYAGKVPIGIAMFDLDDFKAINDSYGHAVGDECLIKFGEIFRKHPELTVYRYGGEEFLAVCDGITEDEFSGIIGSVLDEVTKLDLSVGGVKLTVSAGYGFSVPADEFCDEKMIRDADRALYIAKTSGKNRFVKTS